jgi:GAF domain
MLGPADCEQKVIDAIYRGACDQGELAQAIRMIVQYFDRSGVFFCELDHTSPESQLSFGAGTMDDALAHDYVSFAELDPAPERFAALPLGMATTTDRMFTADFRRRNIFLNEFLRPHGIEGMLAVPLLSAGGRFAMIGMHQGKEQNPFEDEDIVRLERLAPHLTRALQIRRLFLQHEMRGQALEAILDRKSAAIIGIAGDGSSLFLNESAKKIAADRDGIRLDRNGRPVLTGDAATRLTELEGELKRGGAGDVVHVARPSGKPPYLLLVAPLPAAEGILQRTKRRGILYAIHDPSRRTVTTVQRIASLLRLPLGAAKLVAAILDGTELKDYAEREKISINTVKFHLKTAFDRTETRSQAALVRHALLALTDLGPHFHDPS